MSAFLEQLVVYGLYGAAAILIPVVILAIAASIYDARQARRARHAEEQRPPCPVYSLEMYRRRRQHAHHHTWGGAA